MVRIYNGIVVYQNEGTIIIPDYECDDLVVNNIAKIQNARITTGTILGNPAVSNDIVSKGYVDTLINDEVGKKEYNGTTLKGEIFNIYSGDNKNIASGNNSHAEGRKTTASGNTSHAEGYNTTASGNYAHAEGNETTASGNASHAEGYFSTASGFSSHAEGRNTEASGNYSHAEGNGTVANGSYSHAEGSETKTLANCTFAGGWNTVADQNQMMAVGQYNIYDETDTSLNENKLFVVGNGINVDDTITRSDAFVIKNDGSAYIKTKLNINNQDIIIQDSTNNTRTNLTNINSISGNSLTLSNDSTINGELTVNGETFFNSQITVSGDTYINSGYPLILKNENENELKIMDISNKAFNIKTNYDKGISLFYTSDIEAPDVSSNEIGINVNDTNIKFYGPVNLENGTLTAGTGNNQIILNTVNGDISGKTLTLSDRINCGTIKAGTGANQITLDTLTGNVSAGSGNNQIILSASTGNISGKSLTITSGTITTTPTNNNDIANKSYVDSAVSGGSFNPAQTLHLTNNNSLITDGDITTKTSIKTLNNEEGTLSSEITIIDTIGNLGMSAPCGLFYCPKNKKIYTTINDYDDRTNAYLFIYDISTNTSTLKKIEDSNNNTLDLTTTIQGNYNYIDQSTTIIITGQNQSINYLTIYDIDNDSFSNFVQVSYISSIPISPSIDSKYYYIYETNEEYPNNTIYIYKKETNVFYTKLPQLAETIYNVIPLNTITGDERLILVGTRTWLYLFSHSTTNLNDNLVLCKQFQFENDTNYKHMIYGEDKNSVYLYSSDKIHKCIIKKTSSSPYYTFDVDICYNNSSSFSFNSGVVNYDGTLYMFSSNSSEQSIKLEQFYLDSNVDIDERLKLISSKTYENMGKTIIDYCVLINNQLYGLSRTASGNLPVKLIKVEKLNNSSVLTSDNSSLNGNIKINNDVNIYDYPYDINEVITFGKLLKILQNCSIFGNLEDCYVQVEGPQDPDNPGHSIIYIGVVNRDGKFSNGKISFNHSFVNSNQYICSSKV